MKVKITLLKERLEQLENEGYIELSNLELHDRVFHGYKKAKIWQNYLFIGLISFFLLLVLIKTYFY